MQMNETVWNLYTKHKNQSFLLKYFYFPCSKFNPLKPSDFIGTWNPPSLAADSGWMPRELFFLWDISYMYVGSPATHVREYRNFNRKVSLLM